jgi:REP element-mobilizing transposase RayT
MKIEYNNLYTHFVFSTSERQAIIPEKNRIRIEKYITGIVTNNSCRLYAIYANPDHVHFLVSRYPVLSEEHLATIIADNSERFINQNKLSHHHFAWQRSASAFSISKSDVDKVCRYILNQPLHHKKVTFSEEYEQFINHYQETLQRNKVIRSVLVGDRQATKV